MYRKELDGLRALAVGAVLLNHAEQAWLTGGYLGVDSFFVLSGYVVAASWSRRKKEGVGEFFKRRIRRLQPALILMIAISSLICTGIGLNSSTNINTALTSLAGTSNIYLLKEKMDYFGQSAAINPFTHTWSLAVEAQFYLIFPIIGRNKRLLAPLLIISAACWTILQVKNIEFAFYSMPTRLWELGIGIWVYQNQEKLTKSGEVLILATIGLLVSYTLPLDKQLIGTPLAVISTAFLIHNLTIDTRIKRILSLGLFREIGIRSYGIYLWHWPLLIFCRSTWPHEGYGDEMIALVITLSISAISYKLVETPLRKKCWGLKEGAIATITTGIAIYSIGTYQRLYQQKLSYEAFSIKHRKSLEQTKCHSPKFKNALDECLRNKTNKNEQNLILLGDSHAGHLNPIIKGIDLNWIHLSGRNTPNIWLGKDCKEEKYCFDKNELLEKIRESLNSYSIIVVGISPRRLMKSGKKSEIQISRMSDNLKKSLADMIKVARDKHSKIIMIEGLPQIKCQNNQTMQAIYNTKGIEGVENGCSRERSRVDKDNRVLDRIMTELEKSNPGVVRIFKSRDYICSKETCSMTNMKGELIYWDEQAHLTPEGINEIEFQLKKFIEESLIQAKIQNEKH